MIKQDRAYRYATWCVNETEGKTGVYVKKQCASWIKICDDEDPEAYIDEKTYKKILKLLRLMVHPDLRCPMDEALEDYAMLLITAVFCTKHRETGNRYYQTALLKICRKNFKTFTAAVIFIIAMLIEPRFSRFFSVAPDLKLSKELQVAIKKIIKSSPVLNKDKYFKSLRSEIRCPINDSEYTPLAYSEDRMDGKLAAMFLADEAGAMDSYPVEAMRSSQLTLKDKLGIILSTEYSNDNNVLIDETDRAKKILDGLLEDRRYFALIYEPDTEYHTGDRWKTANEAIYQSNPIAVSYPYVFEELLKMRALAILYENKRENFICKHLNIHYKSLGVEGFIDIGKVKECVIEPSLDFWRGRRVYLGLDLSQTDDNTSVAMVTFVEGVVYAKVWAFVPRDAVELKSIREGVDYNKMIKDGEAFACGDSVIDYQFVERFIQMLPYRYGVEIVQLGFDRYNAISSVQKLENPKDPTIVPIECVEIRQHSSVLHPATKFLKEKILEKLFRYEKNRLLEINFQNARCTEDTNLNKYVNKKKSTGKVDMVISIINALYLLLVNEILAQESWGGQSF